MSNKKLTTVLQCITLEPSTLGSMIMSNEIGKPINIRLPLQLRNVLDRKCQEIGITTSELVREMVSAFNEDRLLMKKSQTTKTKLEKLYVD